MKFKLILFTIGLLMANLLNAQNIKYNLLIGTYTSNSKSEGIYVYEFDSKTGELTYKNKATGLSNPSYLAIAPHLKHVYAVNEAGRGSGSISAFKYDASAGQLTLLNKQSSGGEGPCYVSVDATGKYVFAANYGGGSLSAIPIMQDGSLGENTQVIQHQGTSINKARQNKPYVHSVVLSPDNNYLFSPDLGTDKVNVYRFDAKKSSAPLTPASVPFVTAEPGAGPRHFIFHPNKKYAYLVQEMGALVTAYNYKDGKLSALQTVPMTPEGFTGTSSAADIHISPDGKFLYASNRGTANEIVIYSIDQKTGKLTNAGRQSSLGKTPRNFEIDPTGNFLLVANQDSQDIFVFKRDQKTGLLTATGAKLEIGRPVCLKFTKI